MRSYVVVFAAPLSDQDLRLFEREEDLAVEQFVAQLAVKRFDVASSPRGYLVR